MLMRNQVTKETTNKPPQFAFPTSLAITVGWDFFESWNKRGKLSSFSSFLLISVP